MAVSVGNMTLQSIKTVNNRGLLMVKVMGGWRGHEKAVSSSVIAKTDI